MILESVPTRPVLLSASVPEPRHPKYLKAADFVAIQDAIVALARVVLPTTRLVFGGHPTIIRMIWTIARGLEATAKVRLFQTTWGKEGLFVDLEFETVYTKAGRDLDESLSILRTEMLRSESFRAAVFIGGEEGAEQEFRLIREFQPSIPVYPIGSTGGAASALLKQIDHELSEAVSTLLPPIFPYLRI